MKNWIACSSCSIPFLSLFILFLVLPFSVRSQSLNAPVYYHQDLGLNDPLAATWNASFFSDTTVVDRNPNYPDPYSVLYKSMIIPGWGQIVNHQIWKVPIIYGLLGGLAWYSIHLTQKYHDYRAAYYNFSHESGDMIFGPTPAYIPDDAPLAQLRTIRNSFRNRRDMVYIGIALAYGLNIVDAYVFAHMRSFDVSPDLSMKAGIKPAMIGRAAAPGITLSIDLIAK